MKGKEIAVELQKIRGLDFRACGSEKKISKALRLAIERIEFTDWRTDLPEPTKKVEVLFDYKLKAVTTTGYSAAKGWMDYKGNPIKNVIAWRYQPEFWEVE